MKSLVLERNVARFAASRVASLIGSGRGAGVGPLRLLDATAPEPLGSDWFPVKVLLSGICGSDLATVDGRTSRYFEDMVSFPFVPGHEVVGVLESDGVDAHGQPLVAGTRVVIEPVLGCAPRAIEPRCPHCAEEHQGLCGNIAFGRLAPGLQTGFCTDTGGGWSEAGLMAHRSQLHAVPEGFSDRDAVMVEPTACAVHAALSADIHEGDTVAVLGAGTLGLATVAALNTLVRPETGHSLIVGAKHPAQRQQAARFGADMVVPPDQLARAVRRQSGSLVLGGRLTEGAHVVFDCVGTSESIAESLALLRPRGRVVLVGMPGRVSVDLAPLWHKELSITGAYAYGQETTIHSGAPRSARTFELAMEVVAAHHLGELVTASYPLERYEEALAHAGAAGRRGATKIVFDLAKSGRNPSIRPDGKGTP
jgi:threonine dehydrogenase-like Zn-dependent dehydrogenase